MDKEQEERYRKMRATAKETILTPEDEEEFVAALQEVYPKLVFLPGGRTDNPEKVQCYDTLEECKRSPIFNGSMDILVPPPGWTFKIENWPPDSVFWIPSGDPDPILEIFFMSSRLLEGYYSPLLGRDCQVYTPGRMNIGWYIGEDYTDAQKAFIRKVWGIVRKLCTNKVRYMSYKTGKVHREAEKGGDIWIGRHAVDWSLSDPSHVFAETNWLEHGTIAERYAERRMGTKAKKKIPRKVDCIYRPLDETPPKKVHRKKMKGKSAGAA